MGLFDTLKARKPAEKSSTSSPTANQISKTTSPPGSVTSPNASSSNLTSNPSFKTNGPEDEVTRVQQQVQKEFEKPDPYPFGENFKIEQPLSLLQVFKCGILSKEGETVKTWQKRLAVLKLDGIYLYKAPTRSGKFDPSASEIEQLASQGNFIGKITLAANASVAVNFDRKVKYCFQLSYGSVTNSKKVDQVCAQNEEEMISWMKAIRAVIELVSNSGSFLLNATPKQQIDYQSGNPTSSEVDLVFSDEENQDDLEEELGGVASTTTGGLVISATDSHHSASPSVLFGRPIADRSPSSAKFSLESNTHQKSGSVYSKEEEIRPKQRDPYLSIQEEFDLALSGVEIILKREEDRTPEEQAYVIALKQYLSGLRVHINKMKKKIALSQKEEMKFVKPGAQFILEEHMKAINIQAEFGLASGVAILLIPEEERTPQEKEFASSILQIFTEHSKKKRILPDTTSVEQQTETAKQSLQIFTTQYERTRPLKPDEQAYVKYVSKANQQIRRMEFKNGLKAKYDLLVPATISFANYPESRTIHDVELIHSILE